MKSEQQIINQLTKLYQYDRVFDHFGKPWKRVTIAQNRKLAMIQFESEVMISTLKCVLSDD